MGRRKLIAANWKMNLTLPEGTGLVESLLKRHSQRNAVEVAVCPPFPLLYPVGRLLTGSEIKLGAQDVFWLEKGAYTGQVSPKMLVDAGCAYCIVGHSERRGRFESGSLSLAEAAYFCESDATINLKVRSLFYANVCPIVCVGETSAERQANKTESVVKEQLLQALSNVDATECSTMAVAYEPVWAIGTGKVCAGEEAARMCDVIRGLLSDVFDKDEVASVRIIYGGSVNAGNSKDILSRPEIDGALVGGASLNSDEFMRIVLSA